VLAPCVAAFHKSKGESNGIEEKGDFRNRVGGFDQSDAQHGNSNLEHGGNEGEGEKKDRQKEDQENPSQTCGRLKGGLSKRRYGQGPQFARLAG
jgi:hypothetical protein